MNSKTLKAADSLSYKTLLILGVMGLIIGLLVGTVDAIFGRVLLFLTDFRTAHVGILIPFLALVGLLIVFLYQKFGGESSKGMSLIFEVGHGDEEVIPKRLVPLVMVTTWLTHLFGGSAGREGVAVQLGATISHWFSRFFTFKNHSRIFLVTGMAAGFAGLFQTPMAAVLFALEVLLLGNLALDALVPTIIAAFTASTISHALGLEKFSHVLSTSLNIDWVAFFKLIVLGLIFGLVGNLFAYSLAITKSKMAELIPNAYYRILGFGLVLSLFFLILHYGRYSGLGTNLISASFGGQKIYAYDWFLKLLLTVITLAAGFQGGEVTPLFSVGASLGVVLAGFFHLPVELVAAAGYISVFGSATNTFLAPILIGAEVFGYANLPAFFLVSSFAYIVNRRQSIYGLQKILKFD